MPIRLQHVTGVSFPRSGHHLLVRILQDYFAETFSYCEFYGPEDCCKRVPCERRDLVHLSKNHDYRSSVPIRENENYLIQYRSFVPAVISDFELHVRNGGEDSKSNFERYADKQVDAYCSFVKRWANAKANGSSFLRMSYENLTSSPFEFSSHAIRLFDPGSSVDEDRLNAVIASKTRDTVGQSDKAAAPETGVRNYRKVQRFRYHDEELFEKLESATRTPFLDIEHRPVTETFPGKAPTGKQKKKQTRQIVVDASGYFRQKGTSPTGIPRVENFLVRQAMADRDPDVRCVFLDRAASGFSEMDPATFNSTRPKKDETANVSPAAKRRELYEAVREEIRKNPLMHREIDRTFAVRFVNTHLDAKGISATRNERKGFLYQYYKTKIRLMRFWSKLIKSIKIKPNREKLEMYKFEDGTFLLSNVYLSENLFRYYKPLPSRKAFVFHDNIPMDHGGFLIRSDVRDKILPKLRHMREQKSLALCTSDWGKSGLHRFDKKFRTIGSPFGQFPLPSILFEKAKTAGKTDRIEAPKPFVIYCSTIEVRKNHILLARVWKKALDQGLEMPDLLCVGRWGWGVEELQRYLDDNPQLRQSIHFVGTVEDDELIDYYRSALFSVFPSFTEGWGMGASESLDFGLPALVSTADALKEATRDLMPRLAPDDVDGWLKAIHTLASDPEALEKLRLKIRQNYAPVSERQSWETIKSIIRREADL